ncbi:MAG: tripartite tricarboxylate transporter substrate-binding protein [Burkholderiaceae bacterium]
MSVLHSLCKALALAAFAAGLATNASAQVGFPAKPIKVIVPFAAGGATDQVARLLAVKVSEQLGTQVVIENRGGANGNLGAELVAKAAPDGYTLLYTTSSIAYTQAFGLKTGYSFSRELAPVSLLIDQPLLVVASHASGLTTADQLKSPRNANLSYASSGIGNLTHLAMHVLLGAHRVAAVHVPYKGGAGAFPDVIAGRVDLLADPINSAYPYVRDQRVIPLLVTSSQRSPLLPSVPTASESLLPGFTMGAWQALLAPAGTPPAILDKINHAYVAALRDPDVRSRLESQGAEAIGSTPERLGQFVRDEVRRWSAIIKQSDIKLE